jgi:hypothetical protein
MYFTNLTHFLDNKGDIPETISKQVRELLTCFAAIVEYSTCFRPLTFTPTDVNCFKNGCQGVVKSAIRPSNNEIAWYCPTCKSSGFISNWQKTKWDKSC